MISRIEIERKILGSLLNNPDEIEIYLTTLDEKYFLIEKHRKIFNAIKELGSASDIQTIYTNLQKNSVDISVSDLAEIQNEGDVISSRIEYYIQELLNLYIQHRFKEKAKEIAKETEAPEIIRKLEEFINEALGEINRSYGEVLSGKEVAEKIEGVFRAYKNGETNLFIPTGFYELDKFIGGLRPGTLIVLAGRPGMGKTTLAIDIMQNLTQQKIPVLLFSLEMTIESIIEKIISKQINVSINDIHSGKFNVDQVANELIKLAQLPGYYTDSVNTLSGILAHAKISALNGINVFIIDYLQQISTPLYKSENISYQIGRICQRLKNFAVKYNSIVILLSQLSRKVEMREDKRPLLSDLRDSGRIEEHADVVLMLYRPAYYMDPKSTDERTKHQAYLEIKKNRYGATGEIELYFDPIKGFKNLSWIDRNEPDEIPF
jgi:replicative DNA helicase